MPRTKKITVVNIDDNEPKNDEVIDVTEPTDGPIEVPQETIEIQQDPIEKLEVSRVAATDTAVGGVVPEHDIEEVPQPKLVRSTSIMPEKVPTTNEIMREYRQRMMRERIQLRQDKMKNLFANNIK